MADDGVAQDLNAVGLADDWLRLYQRGGAELALAEALKLDPFTSSSDEAVLHVANDLGLVVTEIVPVPAEQPRRRQTGLEEPAATLARQWQFAEQGAPGISALILPVAPDFGRGAFEPGQLPLSMKRTGDRIFLDSICDLVAIPLDGGLPLSLTGMTMAVGRFAARERGEAEMFAGGLTWLQAHFERARRLETEYPAHLVAEQLETPEHFSTLIIEPKALEWRPAMAWCCLDRGTKSVIVRDSLALAAFIDEAMRRKQKAPPLPKVFGPKAGAA